MENTQQIDFYILSDGNVDRRLKFIYRLIEKAYLQKLPALVLVSDEKHCEIIDRMLWEFNPTSFIAHDVYSSKLQDFSSNLIIANSNGLMFTDEQFKPQIVFDLTNEASELYYSRIMIVANQNPVILKESRQKYKIYKDKGVTPNTHKIT